MPIEYCISPVLDLLYARYRGVISLPLFPDIYQIYLSDPDYRLGRPELIDMGGVSRFDLDYEQVRGILYSVARNLPRGAPPIPTAIIAPNDVGFGLARMYQSLAEYSGVLEVSVHRDAGEAMARLDLPYVSVAQLLDEGGFGPMRRGRDDL